VAAGLAGSLLIAGTMLIAWLSAIAIGLPVVLRFGAQVWLLAHGGELVVGDDRVSLVPLGLTLAFGALCSSAGRFAYGQVAAGYTAFAVVLGWVASGAAGVWRPALGALVVSAAGSAVGAGLAAGYRPWNGRPGWLRRGLRGAAAGALGLVVISAFALATALVLGEQRVASLEDPLGLDAGGVFVWSLTLLAYLPTLLGWALAWLLGGGFTVGSGSLVSLSTTQLGMLPALPVLGALPPVGAADPWMLAWLAAGVGAGALAGVVAVRRDRSGTPGGLAAAGTAGAIVAVVFLGWAAASRGGLGTLRLADLGPRLLESLAIGVPLLVLSAALAGIIAWLVWRRRANA
jgi:hypothetical protein